MQASYFERLPHELACDKGTLILGRRVAAWFQHHRYGDSLSPRWIWDREHDCFGDVWIVIKYVFTSDVMFSLMSIVVMRWLPDVVTSGKEFSLLIRYSD